MYLTGQLVCRDEDEARIVADQLAEHTALTRGERGCILFEVTPTADPLVWDVEERFESEQAFTAHQERVAASTWGQRTEGIERRYSVQGLSH